MAKRTICGLGLMMSLLWSVVRAQQRPSAPPDWQAACEASASTGRVFTPQAPRALPSPAWTLEVEMKPRELLSVQWDAITNGPVVLDTREGRAKWLTLDGTTHLIVGRPGQGPGDLEFPPVFVGSRQKLALLGSTGTVIVDGARGSLFTRSGRFVDWFVPDSSRLGMGADVQVARVNDSTILVSQSNRWHPELPFAERTASRLVVWHVDSHGVTRPSTVAILRNPAIMFKPFAGILPNEPYARLHQRTWGFGQGRVDAVAYSFFGICHFPIGSGKMTTSILRAPPRATSRVEQDRVLRAEYGSNPDAIMPGMPSSPRELLEGRWPPHAPYYFDLLVSPAGRALAVRLAADRTLVADVFTSAGRYTGSLRLSTPMVLYAFVGNTLIALDAERSVLAGYNIP